MTRSSLIPPSRRTSRREVDDRRGGGVSRLLAFSATSLLFLLGASPAATQEVIELEVPFPPSELDEPDGGSSTTQIVIDPADDRPRGGPPPIANLDLGDVSANNAAYLASQTVLVRVVSPRPWIPPYRIMARSLTPPAPGVGAFTTTDVGLGVINIVARNPNVNPEYDYDPRLVSKDVDDEPVFLGTIGSLTQGLPRTRLYHSRGRFNGPENSFVLVFAAGPQFYTPSPSQPMIVELAIRVP